MALSRLFGSKLENMGQQTFVEIWDACGVVVAPEDAGHCHWATRSDQLKSWW